MVVRTTEAIDPTLEKLPGPILGRQFNYVLYRVHSLQEWWMGIVKKNIQRMWCHIGEVCSIEFL